MDSDLGMITIKKTPLDQRNFGLGKNEHDKFSSLPDIQIQVETVDSDPSNITLTQDAVNAVSPNDEVDAFNFTYYGHTTIDKRTIPSVFPWIAKRILKHSHNPKDVYANISQSKLWLTERNKKEVHLQDHPFDSIYRLSRMNKNHMDDYLAYIICSKSSGSNAVFHLMKCNDQSEKYEFLNTLKTRVLGFQKLTPQSKNKLKATISPPRPTHKRGASSGAILVSPVKKESVFQDSVYYVGKVNLSQPQAPSHFIDRVLVHLKKTGSQNNEDLQRPSKTSLAKKRFSLDGRMQPSPVIKPVPKPVVKRPLTRKRSASVDSDKYNPHQVNLKNPPKIDISTLKNDAVDDDEYDGPPVSLVNINEEVKSRLISLQFSKEYLSLYSIDTKNLLFQKKIQSISYGTKGDLYVDHFGFICSEGGVYVCYIFQGESEQKVDEIMAAMKTAFVEAFQASADSTLCDSCPIQYLHKLCNNLEGAETIGEKDKMVHETIKVLSDYEQLHVLNEVNEDPESDNERIDITVNVLRELFDSKQRSHRHIHKQTSADDQIKLNTNQLNLSASANSTILGKAKKSFASSFQNFAMKKVRSRSFSPMVFDTENKRPTTTPSKPQNEQQSNSDLKPRSRSLEAGDIPEFGQSSGNGPRLELNLDPSDVQKNTRRTSSIEEVEKKIPTTIVEKKDGDIVPNQQPKTEFVQSHRILSRQQSWRQAIFHSVKRRGSSSSVTLAGDDDLKIKEQNVDLGARARTRWQNAIHNQILLIRMEKENKKLAANISATEIRRQKLSYQDLSTFTEEAASAWDDIMLNKTNEQIDKQLLLELVRGGIPRARRGEIWQFLIKQHMMTMPEPSEEQYWKETPYRSLLKKSSGHQHAILIDLGRTFPTHAHFIPRLGTGQISLFNILTAYSQLDDEVGYCQGLSFVAGVLLMHLTEEEAFKCFCHIMFELQIRDQYKPDMNAVQQQLYQLSRLLHDYHPKVYEHFNKFDVTPTLYAAPWFLTLYASQYPIGFVSRVMDMVLLEGLDVIFKIALVLIGNHANEILERNSFESIVDYMKLDLPTKVVTGTDDIITRAICMDIKQQLNLYEVEYQLLNEEMLDIRLNKEKYERQELAFEEIEQQMIELKKESIEKQKTIAKLEQKNKGYEKAMQRLLKENEALKNGTYTQVDGPQHSCLNIENNEIGNWDLVPSPPSVQRAMRMSMGRAMSVDSGSQSLMYKEKIITCEMDL